MTARVVKAAGPAGCSEALAEACRQLESAQVVAVPTDTVYGLAADPRRAGATGRVFELKRRPADVGLPLLVGDPAQVLELAGKVTLAARRLMSRHWPGALTIVLPRSASLVAELGGDTATVGVRCPDHAFMRELCHRLGPLAVTSANRHGEPELRTAAQVLEVFGEKLGLVVDGGNCAGAPSTVVDCTESAPRCLREGALPWEEVAAAARRPLSGARGVRRRAAFPSAPPGPRWS